MLDVIEYHEGYSLSIYPDSAGVPTVGVGLKLDSSDASFTSAALAAAGVSYSDLLQDWSNIRALFISQHYPIKALRDTSPLWAKFVAQNPSVADDVLTGSQATSTFEQAVTAKLTAAAAFFGTQFYDLDRDPQIASVDLAYHVADITRFGSLARQINGKITDSIGVFATNYILVGRQISAPAVGSVQRAVDDQDLMEHGEDPSTLSLPETVTLPVGRSATLSADAGNAFGQIIILLRSALEYTTSAIGIVTSKVATNRVEIQALREGTTQLTVTDRSTSITAIASVIVAPAPRITWQTSGTYPDVDGTYSGVASVRSITYVGVPLEPDSYGLKITASAKRSFVLDISTFELENISIGTYVSSYSLASPSDLLVQHASIAVGADMWSACIINITSYDQNTDFIAGSFSGVSGGLNGEPVQTGSVSGSFSGIFSSVVTR